MQVIELSQKDIYKGTLILVNKDNQIHSDYIKTIDIKLLLNKIFDKLNIKNELTIVSDYRTNKEQQEIYHQSLIDNGKEYTQKFVALPSHSEHETGLAVDLALTKDNIDFICPDFPVDGICNEFRELSYQYGFIERYKKDKQDITAIGYEPWHFRYVGLPHSLIIKEKNLCLEEYHEYLKQFSIYDPLTYVLDSKIINIFYVNIQSMQTICLKNEFYYQVSGNNKDGVIITAWRNL